MNTTAPMSQALAEAARAAHKGEVPIGAVIVRDGKIISTGRNRREHTKNALAHAEIIAIHKACRRLRDWRLSDCEMYVTLEPCTMCAGAILNARLKAVHIGALADNKSGTTHDTLDVYTHNNLNWKTEVRLELNDACRQILRDFFAAKRPAPGGK